MLYNINSTLTRVVNVVVNTLNTLVLYFEKRPFPVPWYVFPVVKLQKLQQQNQEEEKVPQQVESTAGSVSVLVPQGEVVKVQKLLQVYQVRHVELAAS